MTAPALAVLLPSAEGIRPQLLPPPSVPDLKWALAVAVGRHKRSLADSNSHTCRTGGFGWPRVVETAPFGFPGGCSHWVVAGRECNRWHRCKSR